VTNRDLGGKGTRKILTSQRGHTTDAQEPTGRQGVVTFSVSPYTKEKPLTKGLKGEATLTLIEITLKPEKDGPSPLEKSIIKTTKK